MLDIFTIY